LQVLHQLSVRAGFLVLLLKESRDLLVLHLLQVFILPVYHREG
jgi:hypothetical protein